MSIYIIIFFFILLLCWIPNNKYSILLFTGLGFILTLFASLRGNIGGDYEAYLNLYNTAKEASSQSDLFSVEFTYYYICKIANFLSLGFMGVLFIYDMLAISILFYAVSKLSKQFFFVILFYYSFYFFLHPMIQLRASIAAGLVLVGVLCMIKKKRILFYLSVLIGSCFHISLLIFLPFYYLCRKIKLRPKFYFFFFLIAVIISKLISISGTLLSLLPEAYSFITLKLLSHQNTLEAGIGNRTANIYYIMACLKILFNLFLQSKVKLLEQKEKHITYTLVIHYFAYIIYILLSDMHIVAARIAELLGIVEILLIPMLIYIFRPSYFGKILVCSISFIQLIITLFFIGGDFIKPYAFGF